jgi:microcystin-dependent protein
MSDVYLGQIVMFGGNFAPRGFALCNGQLLSIAQNSALFSLLGTTYGGDGRTTFALPNLQSRLPIHVGQGAGLSNYALGQSSGSQSVSLTTQSMPAHNHMLNATKTVASQGTIGANLLPGQPTGGVSFYVMPVPGQQPPVTETLNSGVCSSAGSGQPHSNLMASLCITFIIALQGLFPSRN